MVFIKPKPPYLGVSERGAARTLNQWLKRMILKKWFPVWCKYSVRPERTKDYLINPEVLPKKFDG
jgi:hypothetical protein